MDLFDNTTEILKKAKRNQNKNYRETVLTIECKINQLSRSTRVTSCKE